MLATKAKEALNTYLKKQNTQVKLTIKKKHVDLFSIVLIAFFDDIMRKEHSGTEMLIDVESFFQKLHKMKIVSSPDVLPDLSSYLAHKTDKDCIDLRRLATATQKYVGNHYFKSCITKE